VNVSSPGKRILLWVLAAALAAAVGCGLPPGRVEFIETLAKDNRKIARAAYDFGQAVQPTKQVQPTSFNAAQVRSAYRALEQALKEVRDDADGQMLPPASNSAGAFLSAYKTYLAGQQDILQNLMLPIVQEVELPTDGNGLPTVADRWQVIDPLLKQVSGKESETYGALTAAQSTYTGEHNYSPTSLSAYVESLKAGK
jgi:hypothetical protein